MLCQSCGIEAPTKYVSFHQNVGVLVMRFSKSISGNLCKPCIHSHFWKMTGITACFGWFGFISMIISPFLIINNVGRYLFCVGMEPVPIGSQPPALAEADVERISEHMDFLVERLNAGGDFQQTLTDVAERAGVSPGQVFLFVQALIAAQNKPQ